MSFPMVNLNRLRLVGTASSFIEVRRLPCRMRHGQDVLRWNTSASAVGKISARHFYGHICDRISRWIPIHEENVRYGGVRRNETDDCFCVQKRHCTVSEKMAKQTTDAM